ncbi:metallophosphoesterase [Bacillus tianshenii]|nr:metallophosphoesterase [Bacillus tianshenii]
MALLFLLFIPLASLLYRAHHNTKQVQLNHVQIDNDGESSLHLNVLQISDMHLENISVSAQDIYEQLKDEPIDLIALTGDFLDRKRSIPKLIPYLKAFNKLNPKHGIYAVFGNHDYVLRKKNFTALQQILEAYHCKTLQNESKTLEIDGHTIQLIGIDDHSTNRSDVEAAYQQVGSGYHFVLTHDPNVVLHMKGYRVDYLLAGHFHGGQICYPKAYHLVKMGKLPRMDMVKGLQEYDGKRFYINEGLGQTGVNIRVGSRPEITIHKLMIPSQTAASAG